MCSLIHCWRDCEKVPPVPKPKYKCTSRILKSWREMWSCWISTQKLKHLWCSVDRFCVFFSMIKDRLQKHWQAPALPPEAVWSLNLLLRQTRLELESEFTLTWRLRLMSLRWFNFQSCVWKQKEECITQICVFCRCMNIFISLCFSPV